MNRKSVESIRKAYPAGTRLCLNRMNDIQAPPPGTEGSVVIVDDAGQIHMKWDNGSSLALIIGEDDFDFA